MLPETVKSLIANMLLQKPRIRRLNSTSSNMCPVGASCSTITQVVSNFCLSNSSLGSLRPGDLVYVRKRHPSPTPLTGRKLTLYMCRFDWDCIGGQRCTHNAHNDEVFGRGFIREGCTSRIHAPQPCTTRDDCDDGQVCVSFYDTETQSCCMSHRVHRMDF